MLNVVPKSDHQDFGIDMFVHMASQWVKATHC